jgi:hypothetical protein
LQEALEARADERHIVAEMLSVPAEHVELGPNLVEGGRFEEEEEGQDGQLERWSFWTYLGSDRIGLYFAGLDSLAAEGTRPELLA